MKTVIDTRNKKSVGKEIKECTIAIGICLLFVSAPALAQAAGDELGSGICKIANMLTGKWLFGFSILATLGAGAALLFGAEMTDGIKKLATIVSIVGLILGMGSLLSLAFSKFSGESCGA